MSDLQTLFRHLFNKKKQSSDDKNLEYMDDNSWDDGENIKEINEYRTEEDISDQQSEEEEYEVVEREILPNKIICSDCGGITLEGLDFCDKCGGEL